MLKSTEPGDGGIRAMSGARVGESINPGRFHSPKNEGPLESGSVQFFFWRGSK